MSKQTKCRAAILGMVLSLAGATLAQAATIYKYRGADGQIEYSTTRPKDRPIIAEMDSKAMAQDQRNIVPSTTSAVTAALERDADARLRQQNLANDNVARAEQNLREAQLALEQGKEPLPGERTGTVSGFARLNESYTARVAGLERAVQLAQAQVEEAYRARNAR